MRAFSGSETLDSAVLQSLHERFSGQCDLALPANPPATVSGLLEANWVLKACIVAKMSTANTREMPAEGIWAILKSHISF